MTAEISNVLRLASPKSPYRERPPIIEGEDVVRAQHGIGAEIAQCADALHVGVARARHPTERTMILQTKSGANRDSQLSPVPRRDGRAAARSVSSARA